VTKTTVWNMSRQAPGRNEKGSNKNLEETSTETRRELARVGHLVELLSQYQSTPPGIPAKAMRWAIRRAERTLDRRIDPQDIARLGSKIAAPLLLIASTRAKAAFNWSNQRRWIAGEELLGRLSEEGWSDARTSRAQPTTMTARQRDKICCSLASQWEGST